MQPYRFSVLKQCVEGNSAHSVCTSWSITILNV